MYYIDSRKCEPVDRFRVNRMHTALETPYLLRMIRANTHKFSILLLASVAAISQSGHTQESETVSEGQTPAVNQTETAVPPESDSAQTDDVFVQSDLVPDEVLTAEDDLDTEEPVQELALFPSTVEFLTFEELQQEFLTNYNGERHPEAEELGEEIVRRVSREHGPESERLVVPLNNLATVQELMGDFDSAESNYIRSIRIVEKHQGRYSADLIRPLTGLGLTYQSAGQHREAIGTFQRAQHVTHRKDGVFSTEQLELLDRITENFIAIEDYEEADRAQRLALKVNERNMGHNSLDVLPALHKMADWFVQSGQYINAVNAYERSIDILEENHGKDHISLLKPLRGIAQAGGGRSRTNNQSTRALERAYEILEKNPDADPVERSLTLIELADIYTITNKSDEAATVYAEAWQTLSEVDDPNLARQELFGEPVKLFHPVLVVPEDSFVRRNRGDYFVEIEFMVQPDGHVTDISVIDGNAPAEARRMIRQLARRARYRPKFEDGAAIAAEGVTSKQEVKVIQAEPECLTLASCRRETARFP